MVVADHPGDAHDGPVNRDGVLRAVSREMEKPRPRPTHSGRERWRKFGRCETESLCYLHCTRWRHASERTPGLRKALYLDGNAALTEAGCDTKRYARLRTGPPSECLCERTRRRDHHRVKVRISS